VTDRSYIYAAIQAERDYQDKKWGGAANDDRNTSYEWVAWIAAYLTKWLHVSVPPLSFRDCMVKVAALAVAAIESCDRQAVASKEAQ